MPYPFETTRTWREAFGNTTDPTSQLLLTTYRTAWDRSCSLAERIPQDAEGLTLHNRQHFESLWTCADRLLPISCPLSPTELFIYGMAILIHDAAHTILCYPGGLNELINTDEMLDNIAVISQLNGGTNRISYYDLSEYEKKIALFGTLRSLHSRQAQTLLQIPYKHKGLDADIYLVDDFTIRRHFSDIVGKIAASHHWDINRLPNIGSSWNAPYPYNTHGVVRPLLLAAILRTADAMQIDSSRATDFAFALERPTGVSRDHWIAQNQLSSGPDWGDSSSLLISSTIPFTVSKINAWWVAYDLATIADNELRLTDNLLREHGMPRLRINHVKDVSSPDLFSRHVITDGWTPVQCELKVDNLAKFVELFGGVGLYGHDYKAPLRELIQNSVDAVHARRLLQPGYRGQIVVELTAGKNQAGDSGYWLRVNDDGLGMSLSMMTGPLLTFGLSGWVSSLLRSERIGLLGKNFQHIGRYGIGFFSVFMISRLVNVYSRPFDKGHDSLNCLSFPNGLSSRPIIIKPKNFDTLYSTSVDIFLDEDSKNRLFYKTHVNAEDKPPGVVPAYFSLSELSYFLFSYLDVDIYIIDHDSGKRDYILQNIAITDPCAWIRRVNNIDNALPSALSENINLVEPVGPSEHPVGHAALNPTAAYLGHYTIGGITQDGGDEFGRQCFVGCLERDSAGPRRNVGGLTNRKAVADWAHSQVQKWATTRISPEEKHRIAVNAAWFEADPTDILTIKIDGEWHSIHEVFAHLDSGSKFFAIIAYGLMEDIPIIISPAINIIDPPGRLESFTIEQNNLIDPKETRDMDYFWCVEYDNEFDSSHINFINILRMHFARRGKRVVIKEMRKDLGFYSYRNNRNNNVYKRRIKELLVTISLSE